MPNLTIFLDDGGVMNENSRRSAEWRRLLGEFFAPRLGSTAAAWAEANRVIIGSLWEKHFLDQALLGLVDEYHGWSRRYQIDWLRTMAGHVGVPAPADDDEALSLAVEAAEYVTHNCRAWFEDAPGAIEALAGAGYALNTASGEESRELHGYLSGMGVRQHFRHLFGPDLVNAFKAGPAYYQRAFAMAAIDPGRCLVVDDATDPLLWAARAGALTVLVDRTGLKRGSFEGPSVSSLAELPALLDRLPPGA